MKCLSCNSTKHRVLETRVNDDNSIKRRRECLKCNEKFSTLETIISNFPTIVKRNGEQEAFHKNKILKGIQLACQKRPVSLDQIEAIATAIADECTQLGKKEISSLWIGKQVMRHLKKLDDVAYVRFASVYKSFNDVQEFIRGLDAEENNKDNNE